MPDIPAPSPMPPLAEFRVTVTCAEFTESRRPELRPAHRLRDSPYPDELDQEFCGECRTLCMDGRPCECCWVTRQEEAEGA